MEYTITGNEGAVDLTRHIADSGTTTTLPADAKPFGGWEGSDSVPSAFTDMDFTIPPTFIPTEMSIEDMERFVTEWAESCVSHIAGFSVSPSTDISPRRSSTDGSNGLSPEEAEP